MTVSDALKDTLFTHSKIALPGLGTFVGEYSAAYIHPTQHLFQPPYKKITFEPGLKTDDNILTNYLIDYNKWSADTARTEIAKFVNEISLQLDQERKYAVEGLGTWYFDIEKQLQFKADESVNFMKEAYGLPPFVSEMVTRKNTAPALTKTKQKAADDGAINLSKLSYIILGVVVAGILILAILHLLNIHFI